MNSPIRFNRVKAIIRKEIAHVLRDPFTLAMAVFIPAFLVTIFGYAIDFDIRDLKLTLFDEDKTQASRTLWQTFSNSGYFNVSEKLLNSLPAEELNSEKAKAVLLIPPQFEKDFESGRGARAQLLLDGADNSTIGSILGYIQGIQSSATGKFLGEKPAEPIKIQSRYLFNPELKTNWFIIPGLSVVVIAILSILLTALTIAREWEVGSMELLLSTPVKPMEIIIGKLTPYLFLGLLGASFVYIAARIVFGIPFKGSHLLLFLGSALFLSTYLSMGLIISVITRKQQIAMQLSIITGLLPSQLLSGWIFPIENMSPFWQYFTALFPARWFMVISRALYLKNADFMELIVPFTVLFIMSIILIFIATKRFKVNLEP